MSIDSIGLSGIGDGRPMKTADLSRVQAEAAARKRQEALDLQAEGASGIGEPDEDEFKTEDRQPDGQLPWKRPEESDNSPDVTQSDQEIRQQAAGQIGTTLDISG